MAKKRSFYDLDYADHIGGSVYFILNFIAFVLVTVGTPLGQLMIKKPDGATWPDEFHNPCYTLWGIHNDCHKPDYYWRVEYDQCPARRFRLESAEAFSIIAIFFTFFQIFAAYMLTAGSEIKTTVLCMTLFTAACTVVPFAVVAALYNTNYCGDWTMTHRNNTYGAGFYVLIASFAVQMIGFFVVLFLEPEPKPKKVLDDSERVTL